LEAHHAALGTVKCKLFSEAGTLAIYLEAGADFLLAKDIIFQAKSRRL
jgi:hypothetical protein